MSERRGSDSPTGQERTKGRNTPAYDRPASNLETSSERANPAPDLRPAPRGRWARLLLPDPSSIRHGLSILLFGFVLEGGTEFYQFLARANLVQGPIVYYATLATSIFGFYLMFLGLREWHALHPKLARVRPVPPSRPWPWVGLAFWVGGTASTAVLSLALGGGGAGSSPFWITWPVGGVVVLAFGSFFLGLRQEAQLLGSSTANAFGWVAFTWSLGVATVSGFVVGELAVRLLIEFVTNWAALIASVGPIVVAMSPLFVTYSLIFAAFVPGVRASRDGRRATPSSPATPPEFLDRGSRMVDLTASPSTDV
jgi:hypothetical protein